MSSKEKKPITIRPDEKILDKIDELAFEKGITRNAVIDEIFSEHFVGKNKYQFLDDACTMLKYLEEDEAPKKKGEGFYCLKRAPKEDKLGSGIDEAAKKYCEVCKLRDGALADSKTLREQREKGISIQVARCMKGGYVNDEHGEQMYCPEIGRSRPVYERKKKTDYVPCKIRGPNNSNCMYLKQITVVKGLKEKDHR